MKWKGYYINSYFIIWWNIWEARANDTLWIYLEKQFLSELRVQMSLAWRCCFHQRLISEHAGSRFLYLHLCYFYSPKVQGGILMYTSPIRCFVCSLHIVEEIEERGRKLKPIWHERMKMGGGEGEHCPAKNIPHPIAVISFSFH